MNPFQSASPLWLIAPVLIAEVGSLIRQYREHKAAKPRLDQLEARVAELERWRKV